MKGFRLEYVSLRGGGDFGRAARIPGELFVATLDRAAHLISLRLTLERSPIFSVGPYGPDGDVTVLDGSVEFQLVQRPRNFIARGL